MADDSTKPSFDWSDPLLLDGQLCEDERLVRDAARDYAQDKLMPRVLSAFREERFDRETPNRHDKPGLTRKS